MTSVVENNQVFNLNNVRFPSWWKFELLHLTHKCNLLRKLPQHYSKFFILNPYESQFLGLGYYWPHKHINSIETDWYKLCDPIGTGAPAQWRYKRQEIEEWIDSGKTIDPITKAKLRGENGKYKVLYKAAVYYGLLS